MTVSRRLASLLLVPLALSAVWASPEADPMGARVFELKFRPVADAAELVGALLSPEGSVSMQPRLRTITVQDHASVLARIPAVLADFDLPPRNVEVSLALFLGTDRREAESGRNVPADTPARDVRGVTETLGDFTKWNAYEPLGGRSVTGVEGSRVEVEISEEYRVSYVVESVEERRGAKLKGLTLERRTRGADGAARTQVLYRTDIVLPPGRMLVLGAAQNPESKRALFLTLQASAR